MKRKSNNERPVYNHVLPTDAPPPHRCMCWGQCCPCRSHSWVSSQCSPANTWRYITSTNPPPPYHIVAPPHTHVQAFGVFGLCQIHAFVDFLRSKLSKEQFDFLFKTMAILVVVVVAIVGGTLTFLGSILITMTTSVFSLTPSPQRLA